MFAVIRSGGKQYKVQEGDTLDIELVEFPAEGEKKLSASPMFCSSATATSFPSATRC